MAADVAMDDMDIDFNMDGDEDPEIARLQAEAAAINARSEAEATDAMNGVEEAKEEGEFDPHEIQPTKVHVRGVDKLNENEVKQWVSEHVGFELFKRVEWINDSCANLIFDTEVAAIDALNTLSAVEDKEPLEPRRAKELSTHPDIVLEVRQSIVTDVKVKGAKDRSAFYLNHKEWDPDNPHGIRPGGKRRREYDGGYERNKYRRRDWEDERQHRRGSRDVGNFTEDMYDEGGSGTASAPPENRRASDSSEYNRRKVTFDDDLFGSRQNGRLRDRSASPSRDGDGRYGFSEEQPRRRTARPRSSTPPAVRKNRDNREAHARARKELFPSRPTPSAFSNGHAPERPSTPTGPRELFPDKSGTPNHRRQDGRDLPLDEVVGYLGRSTINDNYEYNGHVTYDSRYSGAAPSSARASHADRGDRGKQRDLFDRPNGGTEARGSGRLSRDGDGERRDGDMGISIKGSAKNGSSGGGRVQEFSFLGASSQGQKKENSLARELFPEKNGGPRKDLFDFDGRIKGRASGRRRAEDLI